MMQPTVMKRMDAVMVSDGSRFRRKATLSARLTSGVHLFTAPYIGMFMPCRAVRLQAGEAFRSIIFINNMETSNGHAAEATSHN